MGAKEIIRKHYEKPQVNQIKLEIEEAVLLNCKVDAGSPGKIGTGQSTCGGNSCKTTFGS